jgi:hypothetical protein
MFCSGQPGLWNTVQPDLSLNLFAGGLAPSSSVLLTCFGAEINLRSGANCSLRRVCLDLLCQAWLCEFCSENARFSGKVWVSKNAPHGALCALPSP